METFHRWVAYWLEPFKAAKAVHNVITCIIFGAALVLSILGFSNDIVNPIVSEISRAVVISLTLWGLLWFPFKRHEAQERAHATEKYDLQIKSAKDKDAEAKRLAEIVRKMKIREELAKHMFAISDRRANIEWAGSKWYEEQMKMAPDRQDKDSIAIFLSAYKFIEATYGKIDADLFATKSGFQENVNKPEFERYDKLIYFFKQYEARLKEMIDKVSREVENTHAFVFLALLVPGAAACSA
jgi:hypothetical protein